VKQVLDRSQSTEPRSLCDYSLVELEGLLAELGQPAYRARQIWRGIFQRFSQSFEELSDLPASLRTELACRWKIGAAETAVEQVSSDGSTRKALLRLADGELVETVLMRYPASPQGRKRNTVCISTQAGCAMGCSFCATGQQGFRRNLTPGEISGQVLHFARQIREEREHITNIVFMGMGEPLANYGATLRAVETLNNADGFALGARHMTISTVGLVHGIRRLAQEPFQVGLALSLHTPDDEQRRRLIPTARLPIAEILSACNDYAAATGRRYSVEYAERLGSLLSGLPCHVNLIPVNPTSNDATRRPSRGRVLDFQRQLVQMRINCTVRVEKGVDIMAGCGQLRGTAAVLTVGGK
jgi:23S rRNA (adenine2503-C2)-methyltransferase